VAGVTLTRSMHPRLKILLGLVGVFLVLLGLHAPLLSLPYFWDEAGYYIPAALDFYRSGMLIPQSTLPTGHTPLVTIYLAMAWRVLSFSPLVTRAAMLLLASATVGAVYALGRRVASREAAVWAAALLAVMPLFFAQSSLAHLDLAAALFTTLALLFLLEQRIWKFALAASLAILSKETAVVLLPVAWAYMWRHKPDAQEAGNNRRGVHRKHSFGNSLALVIPLLPLAAWSLYYHHATGYWTGNREYLSYNLTGTLAPGRIFWALLRRLYETFIGGFNWVLAAAALAGVWYRRRGRVQTPETSPPAERSADAPGGSGPSFSVLQRKFVLLALGLAATYLLLLSVVGGAVLPRYLLPVFPPLILLAVLLLWQLPIKRARLVCGVGLTCLVVANFLNPPYPFPFEDNLAYADFVRLHQQAARFLSGRPGQPRILTAWPASDELARPFLGYVREPLRVVPVAGYSEDDFRAVQPESFDVLYLYSRKWQPRVNALEGLPWLARAQQRYFGYQPQARESLIIARYRLTLIGEFERRGQWVRIYAK